MNNHEHPDSYWKTIWKQFRHHRLGLISLYIVVLFCLIGIYAPFFASSKPLIVFFDGEWYFPLFRYLFYRGFFTKRLDLFYNLLIFTLPLCLLSWFLLKSCPYWRRWSLMGCLFLQIFGFLYVAFRIPQDPESNPLLNQQKQKKIQSALFTEKENPLLAQSLYPNWESDLKYMTSYAKLNQILHYQLMKAQSKRLQSYEKIYLDSLKNRGQINNPLPILWYIDKENEREENERFKETMRKNENQYPHAKQLEVLLNNACKGKYVASLSFLTQCDFLTKLSKKDLQPFLQAKQIVKTYEMAQANLLYNQEKAKWLEENEMKIHFEILPLIRPFHWEDDAGGSQNLNQVIGWWELTRINRKDMVAALLFGVRISLTVGLCAVALALAIGIPIGALSGYYGGKIDILTYRLIEIWESMPTFFMLLMIVAFLQNKSIFIIVAVVGLFGWTGFSRFIRGEFLKQKQLPYVEACRALGFNNRYIMFSHLLPNAIPPILTLVPFAIMGAITSEAGLSFLGLGEEGSASWGVLMDEGRTAFPAESYLLWPPAILLTIFLVSIALVGDSLRDSLDPKLHKAS